LKDWTILLIGHAEKNAPSNFWTNVFVILTNNKPAAAENDFHHHIYVEMRQPGKRKRKNSYISVGGWIVKQFLIIFITDRSADKRFSINQRKEKEKEGTPFVVLDDNANLLFL
jgi:hypothetical protein